MSRAVNPGRYAGIPQGKRLRGRGAMESSPEVREKYENPKRLKFRAMIIYSNNTKYGFAGILIVEESYSWIFP